MTEQELNSYRFTSGEEPSDEMLAQIMKEAAAEDKERNERVNKKFFEDLRSDGETLRNTISEKFRSELNV